MIRCKTSGYRLNIKIASNCILKIFAYFLKISIYLFKYISLELIFL